MKDKNLVLSVYYFSNVILGHMKYHNIHGDLLLVHVSIEMYLSFIFQLPSLHLKTGRCSIIIKKSLKIPNGGSEAVSQRTRQYNGQKKKDRMKISDIQNTTQRTKD